LFHRFPKKLDLTSLVRVRVSTVNNVYSIGAKTVEDTYVCNATKKT